MSGSFVFDAGKCTGCGACRVACTIENGLAPDVSWRRIETFNPQRRSIAPVFHLSLACNHCATAACMNACPALAYRRDGPTGAVLLNSDLCIGCGYCSWACPYDAPVFDEAAGVMTKCTWCADRLRAGLKPSCAVHCPTGALDYRHLDPAARVTTMPGLPQTALGPSLHVIPAGATVPAMSAPCSDSEPPGIVETAGAQPNISLEREWPLAVFTLGAALLVALIAAAAAGAVSIPAAPFIVAAGLVMSVAGAHLGRKARAWRAVLNVRRSWLSREIVVMSGFVALASGWLVILPDWRPLGAAAALTGFAGLFCADRVYGVLPGGPGYRHSAGVITTAALLAAALTGQAAIAVGLIAIKAWMYFGGREERRLPPPLGLIRVLAGFAAPLALLALEQRGAATACLLGGEALGRCEYYMQLARSTPRRHLDRALASAPITAAALQ